MTSQTPDQDHDHDRQHEQPSWYHDYPELQLGTSWPEDRRYRPRSSSRWLSPPQLILAGYKQLLAGLFESFSDRRDSLETRTSVVLAHPDVEVPKLASLNGSSPEVRPLFPVSFPEGEDPKDRPVSDQEGFWFDYVADLGDGFSATYSVAEEIAMTHEWTKEKQYQAEDGSWHSLRRGELLVMGGDEVYPLASDTEYRNRTIGPYETACRHKDDGMALLAVPGNHDWYDGLTAFLSRFCSQQWIGGWQTRQTRSYWAAKVQEGWWIWGVDLALEHTPIDHHQMAYFKAVAASLLPEDRIILVTPKPAWLRDHKAWIGGGSPAEEPYNPSYDQLSYFMDKTLRAWKQHHPETAKATSYENEPHFAMVLAGDKHCYSRYDNQSQLTDLPETSHATADPDPSGPALIDDDQVTVSTTTRRLPHVLCGGGGAYLSLPFHHAKRVSVPRRWRRPDTIDLDLEKQWPSRSETNKLAVTALWRIVLRNWGFGMLLGAIYLLFARAVDAADPVAADPFAPTLSWGANLSRYAEAVSSNLWVFLLTIGLVLGLQTRSRLPVIPRLGLAVAQTAIHLGAIAGCDALARWTHDGGAGLSGARWTALVLSAYALSWALWGFHRVMHMGRSPKHTLLAPALFGIALYIFVYEPSTWSWFIPMLGFSSVFGAVVFAATLLISAYTFGDKENLVSVAVREAGWKNFLRIHIDGDTCRVWAVGLQKVPFQRLVFRKDGVENYDGVKNNKQIPLRRLGAEEPAKFTPKVTPVYDGLLGNNKEGFDAQIIDSWTVHRHPESPATARAATSPAVEQSVSAEVSV